MTYIDSALLDVTEWCCRRFQLMTGRTNVWLALQLTNLSIIVYFVWAGAMFWSDDWSSRILLAASCGGLLYVLTQTIFKESIEAIESHAYRRAAKGLRNPRRLRDAPLRISFLSLSIVLLWPIAFVYQHKHLPVVYMNLQIPLVFLTYSLIVLTTVVLYVLACDPLPPSEGKVKDMLQALAQMIGVRKAAVPRDEPASTRTANRFDALRQRLTR